MNPITNIIRGDSVSFECNIGENITNWKIRCEIYNTTHTIKKATANISGGSDSQIQITDTINGKFIINIEKNETNDMGVDTNIEIEVETSDNKSYTVYQNKIIFNPQRINWETIK